MHKGHNELNSRQDVVARGDTVSQLNTSLANTYLNEDQKNLYERIIAEKDKIIELLQKAE